MCDGKSPGELAFVHPERNERRIGKVQVIGLSALRASAMNAFSGIAVLLLLSFTATAGSIPQRNAQGLLADTAGHTLYRYDLDRRTGSSHCYGPCAAVWPPYLADPGAVASGDYSLTTRSDGHLQWVYQGHLLYLFAGDAKPGDRDGDGVNGSWHVLH